MGETGTWFITIVPELCETSCSGVAVAAGRAGWQRVAVAAAFATVHVGALRGLFWVWCSLLFVVCSWFDDDVVCMVFDWLACANVGMRNTRIGAHGPHTALTAP